jgi:ABC-type polysaccharide/polyol phosphate transport system ATPase subunit
MGINTENVIEINNLNKLFEFRQKGKTTIKKYCNDLINKRLKKQSFKALDNINLTVKRGEFIGVIGKNGSGKSTLMKIIAGIYSPDSGIVICREKVSPILGLGVGFNNELTGVENIFLSGLTLGMTKEQIKDKVDEIIDFAELKDFANQIVKNYSSGMRARLGFAVTTAVPFKGIFLMDEILAVGDEGFRQKSLKRLEEFLKQGKTIIFISHNLEPIIKYSSRVMVLHHGTIKYLGSSDQAINCYQEIIKNE